MDKPIFDIVGKRIWIAGSRGLVGSACKALFETLDCALIDDPHRDDLDLCDMRQVQMFIADQQPDAIILAAAKVGGIGDNASNPEAFYDDNITIQNAVINSAVQQRVKRLVFLGSSCIYPRDCPQPIKEEYLGTGALEQTNEAYARAKIEGIRLIRKHRRHGFDYVSVMPCNLYGSNDHFIDGLRPHVIPALMHKFYHATDTVEVWGTGMPLREFLHVDDLARAVLCVLEHYSDDLPINIGSGIEVTIRGLAETIADISGFKGSLEFDLTKPDGTPRKILDSSRMRALGWTPQINLREGLEIVWNDYVSQVPRADYRSA